jgi:HD-GYP domain-containing protein (c-di-GMP phosphodiesterase class II)
LYASRRSGPVSTDPRFDGERAVQLISDIVPLLTSPGSREDKLRLVAHHISLGGGYDAVNIEVAGIQAGSAAEWERTFVKAPGKLLEAWAEEQRNATDHPLGKVFQEHRGPVFLDDLWTDERLTPAENEILHAAGLKCAVVVPMIWQDELVGMLSVVSAQADAFSAWDASFLSAIANHVTAIVFMTELVDELRTASGHLAEAHAETVMMLAAAAEAHDHTTGRHLQRVRAMTEALAHELGYGAEDAHTLGLASVLHDVGKIRVPNSILSSPYKLSEEEWREMRQHTIWGAQFLEGRHGFDLATVVARCHHERWDGGGYPQGLSGDEIPEAASITSVADSFDAITSDRPYRSGRSAREAVEEIESCAGKQFSPRVVAALRSLFDAGELPLVEKEHREDLAAAA